MTEISTLWGATIVGLGGAVGGGGNFPLKFARKFRFEHIVFISSAVMLFILPWLFTLLLCPHALEAYRTVDPVLLLKANLFSIIWGVANILCAYCYMRIGFVLASGILTGVSMTIGTTVPMLIKGSGLFKSAPDLGSPAGWAVMTGVAVTLVGVVCVSLAGFGRVEKQNRSTGSGEFLGGLFWSVLHGICAAGLSFSFVYSQGPILRAMKEHGASDIGANFAVWAAALFGGGLVSVLYPAYLMAKNGTWRVLTESWTEVGWFTAMGVTGCLGTALMGKGMIILGPLGASVGYGIQRSSMMASSAAVGFICGEWRDVNGRPWNQVRLGILLLIVGAIIMAYGNSLA